MKHKTHHLYYLYYPRIWVISAVLLFTAIALAQEQTPPPEEFVIGATFDRLTRYEPFYYEKLREAGMNFLPQYADNETKILLGDLNFIGYNSEWSNEWIYYYSTAYYSKWEAEEDQIYKYKVGSKHRENVEGDTLLGNLIGSPDTLLGRQCWTTKGLSAPACSLMYGPHYHQEKTYKRWYEDQGHNKYDLKYTPRFIMALKLEDGAQLDDTASICRLSVVERYRWFVDGNSFSNDSDMVLKSIILKASDFQPYDTFKVFYFGNLPEERWYDYPPEFRDPENGIGMRDFSQFLGVHFFDRWGDEGVQFTVDWLGDNTKCNLYIDYVEAYDNKGGQDFADDPGRVDSLVREYAQAFPSSQWSNMKYWGGCDEPSSLDDYIPLKTVDAILNSIEAPRLITTFYPWWEGEVNGENQLVRYYNTVHPDKLIIDFFPALPFRIPVGFEDWETTREMFQTCSSLQPGFWYQAQAAGVFQNGEWIGVRRPDSVEFKAQNMLALAHGVKGLIYWHIRTWGITRGLLDPEVLPQETDLYRELRDHFVPRLKGKLGKTLMSLNYSGNYLQYRYQIPTDNPEPVESNYLILGYGTQALDERNWHCGFFDRLAHPEDKYFMLANLYLTADSMTVLVKVTPPVPNYQNYRFRNVEGYFDETFQTHIIKDLTHLKGEGYLYEVAPVIKYGGRLLHSESTQPGMILNDDMIIENGAVLTVNGVYSSKGNITVKSGGIINGSNGKIQFAEGKKLIIEGSGSITGIANSKLHLEFSEPVNDDPTGIMIKANGSLTISKCKIENATIGINSLLNATHLNAQNIEFINCETYSINIAGRNPGMNPTPPPQINGCLIQNSDYGISVISLPGLLIQGNTITNTDCGIYLSNVTDAQLIGNIIESNREAMSGIYCQSSGGVIRANIITGHTSGIHLANSSPKLGGNTITSNKYHGLYIGAGSLPFMRGEYVGDPPNMYALSGYNGIMENGGYQEIGGPPDNDGSEIYFFNSNAQMDRGCNSIVDDRQVSPPLINTLLLMNGYSSGFPIIVQAQNNFWGDTVYAARFGNLTVNYVPYESVPCPVPQEGGEEELILRTSFGEVIDTVYSTGEEVIGLSATELAYAEAEEYFLTGDLSNALQIYEGIINSTTTEEEKYLAYQRKYSIGKLTGQSTEYFNQLSNTFTALASNTQDTLSNKILNQFSTLSKVGEQEYETAIAEFDNIVQQNPNTEEAVYAEIDALTTALLLEEADSTLQKGRLGKYLIKSSSDYNQRIDEILRKHFGSSSKENQKELIPTDFTLYQNFPNPFNPVTTIKYDLPNTSDVSLIIYDILGRKVKKLVNTKQQAGKYEVQFDASNLASGVYIYQLLAEKFISSKKMILLH